MFRKDSPKPSSDPSPTAPSARAQPQAGKPTAPAPPRQRSDSNSPSLGARLGTALSFKGEISGDEDLVLEGTFEGLVRLANRTVTIGPEARIEGDIHAKTIAVDGHVTGNLYGESEVVIGPSARVDGNLSSPRVNLKDGCRFQGSIDMTGTEARAAGNASKDRSSENGRSEAPESPPARAAKSH